MRRPFVIGDNRAARRLKWVAQHPEVIGFLFSALCLIAYLGGGDRWLLAMIAILPASGLFLWRKAAVIKAKQNSTDGLTGLKGADLLADQGQTWLTEARESGRRFACFRVGVDGYSDFVRKHGETAAQHLQRHVAARILRGLREDDLLARVGDGQFMFLLTPVRHLDLEICVQLAARLKSAIEAAMPIDATTVRITASFGFCRSDQIQSHDFKDLEAAADLALRAACHTETSAIRAYSKNLQEREASRSKLSSEAADALQLDQIKAWFQPQISNETGEITGFEALARWEHPQKGILTPVDFMDALTKTGQLEQLADFMLKQALEAQNTWQRSGIVIPHVGVNFAGEELHNPMLVEKIHWELDRFDLSPNRIAIEVLETVIADAADGAISRNVNGLANLGCYIELDDFGTGHASISSIRRFAVSRLKIDRSFVMKVDTDPEQQKLVSAIVTMAERMGMDTLAEGVETAGEHAMLAQLGCGHAQGYGIARPMPFEQTIPWIKDYNAKRKTLTPLSSRKALSTPPDWRAERLMPPKNKDSA